MPMSIREFCPEDQAACEAILRSLPQWFGIERSLVQYVKDAADPAMQTWIAEIDSTAGGFITVREHFSEAAEIHCIAVRPEHHRNGVGRAMIKHVEIILREGRSGFLQVKTLGPSRPDPNYAKTRAFYLAMGFVPLEEFPNLWPGNPCLLLVKKL